MTLHVCPTRAFAAALRPLRDMEQRLVDALTGNPGGVVTHADVISAMWGDAADGGPEKTLQAINQYVFRLRRRGFSIAVHDRHGLALMPSGSSNPLPRGPGRRVLPIEPLVAPRRLVQDDLLAALRVASPRPVAVADLVGAAYGADRRPPPRNAPAAVVAFMSVLRRKGHAIEVVDRRSGRSAGYALISSPVA